MNFKEALHYLSKFANYETFSNYNYKRAYNLDRIRRLLQLLDNPQSRYHSVVVTGTKGKGSASVILASILNSSALRVGLFTSPHLVSIRERIKINGKDISKQDFSETISKVRTVINKNNIKGLTYFEILTALCFLHFSKKNIDIAVLEVGLGGRLDATRVADPIISLITPISYDHTHLLGDTLYKISKEKCGIITENSYVVSAPQAKQALGAIREKVRSKRAKLLLIGRDATCKNIRTKKTNTFFDAKTGYSSYDNIRLKLIGRHQAANALLALAAVEILKNKFGFTINKKDIRSGLSQAYIPGRLEIVSKSPHLLLDGAQNRASAKALRSAILDILGKRKLGLLILGISSDKDAKVIGEILCPLAKRVIFTKANTPRAIEPELLAEKLGLFCNECYVTYDPRDAFLFANSFCTEKDTILATGSLFLIGDIFKILGKKRILHG